MSSKIDSATDSAENQAPAAPAPVSVSPEQQELNEALGRFGEAQLQLEFWTEAKTNAKRKIEAALKRRDDASKAAPRS